MSRFQHALARRTRNDVCPVVGIMSGTSLDGLDLVLALLQGSGSTMQIHRVVAFETIPLESDVRHLIRQVLLAHEPASEETGGQVERILEHPLSSVCRLHTAWSRFVGRATREFVERAWVRDVSGRDKPDSFSWAVDDVIVGSHGQTLWHSADAPGMFNSTLQLGDGEVLARYCGMVVVSNFRSGDIAVGGCGAPLVPYFDRILVEMIRRRVSRRIIGSESADVSVVRADEPCVALQNLGGIGNVTLFCGASLLAFDTGPANVILNEVLEQLYRRTGHLRHFADVCWKPLNQLEVTSNSCSTGVDLSSRATPPLFDIDGFFSSRGHVHDEWLQEWWGHAVSYFEAPPPKSCGRELFGSRFVETHCMPKLEPLIKSCESPDDTDAKERTALTLFQRVCDMCRTAVTFTAMSIREAYVRHLPQYPDVIALSGGGVSNPVLLEELEQRLVQRRAVSLPDCPESTVIVSTLSNLLGTDLEWRQGNAAGAASLTLDDAKEALAFAVLAHEKLNELAGCFNGEGTNEPAATGARCCVVLGQISAPSPSRE